MQDRGLAAYIAELLGTLILVFIVTSVVVLYVAAGQNAQFLLNTLHWLTGLID